MLESISVIEINAACYLLILAVNEGVTGKGKMRKGGRRKGAGGLGIWRGVM